MEMKKLINDLESLTPELLEGSAKAHKELVILGENRMIVNNKLVEADRVTIMIQSGSGHEPATSGSTGEGTVSISVVGDAFATPGPQTCLDVIKLVGEDKGVFCMALSHAGDMLTGNLIAKKRAKEGLNVAKVVTQEDIANASRFNADDRRGLVECIPTYKVAGATAAEGKSLGEVAAIAQWFADSMTTLVVAISGATRPATGSLLADPGEDEMEIGAGQHGEGGGGCQAMKLVDETTKIILDGLLVDLDIREGEKIMLILNGTDATTLMELFVVYHRCVFYLKEKNTGIVSSYVGELPIVQKQAGSQMSMVRTDNELLHYWNAPYNTPYMKK